MFVIIPPDAKHNTSGEYQVADNGDVTRFLNGSQKSYAFVSYPTWDEANRNALLMNGELKPRKK